MSWRHKLFSKDTWMPGKLDRKTILLAVGLFLIIQTAIYGAIPKDTDPIRFNVIVKNGTSRAAIARLLEDQGLLRSSGLFLALSLPSKASLKAGEYSFSKNMSTIEIIRKMANGERNVYVLKIVEGYNIYNIADTVEAAGIMKRDGFLALAQNSAYLRRLGITGDSLEGYLWPDTYYYSKEVDPDRFIQRIVQRTVRLFDDHAVRDKMHSFGFDIHRTLTLASMIEKEARLSAEKPVISAVFHNRIAKGMSFDSDPTVIYGTRAFHSPITRTDLLTYTPYNTYTFKGFPKGPICNPDKSSILAAINPARVDYLFFVSRNDGTHVFSRDMVEHNRYVQMYQRSKRTKIQ